MPAATIIFPHQLYQNHPALAKDRPVYLVEEFLFFMQFKFHKKKIMLHRASMKSYGSLLHEQLFHVEYIEAINAYSDIRQLVPFLSSLGINEIHVADVTDEWLEKRLTGKCREHGINMIEYPAPNFLNTPEGVKDYFDKKNTYFQTSFYIEQRKQRNILLSTPNEPESGRWSFDKDNRQRFPEKGNAPLIKFPNENKFVTEAREYVSIHFRANYGDDREFFYPIDHSAAEAWLDDFIQNRLARFGIYEDAIVSGEHFLNHSVLSPLLNTGLLLPQQVIDKVMTGAAANKIPLNSLEGFIRQIIGWREFIRIIYSREGNRQRTRNFWGFKKKIPESFWNGTTGIEPVDQTIKKVLSTGYCHHIERLMILGNFMVLCEFDPDKVYHWFMELFIDSYDWVMVPNVYGMTQFADGGLMTTKPYISGSNYLVKMSNYKKGKWSEIWDGLFWRFMHYHRNVVGKNQRLGMLIKTFDKMSIDKQETHLNKAEDFLNLLDNQANYTLSADTLF